MALFGSYDPKASGTLPVGAEGIPADSIGLTYTSDSNTGTAPAAYGTYVFGQNAFVQPTTATWTATGVDLGQGQASQRLTSYYDTMQAQQLQYQHLLDQQKAWLRDVMLYGQGTGSIQWPWQPEEAKALEIRPLTAADREELERSLPF